MPRIAPRATDRTKIWLVPVLAVLLLALVYGLISNSVAAWVGGKVITQQALSERASIIQYSYDLQWGNTAQHNPKFAQQHRREIVEQLVEEYLLLRDQADLATAEEQEEYATSVISFLLTSMYQNDRELFAADLANHNITEEQLKSYFANNLLLVRLRDMVADTTVSDDEVQNFYQANRGLFDKPEMVKASHILVSERQQAEELLQQLKQGADFAELAKEHSQDPETAPLGGSLPWFARGQMLEPFEEAAFALEPGQLSMVIQTRVGYHIIKSEGKEPAREQQFNQVRALVKERALEDKRQRLWNDYRTSVRSKGLVFILTR